MPEKHKHVILLAEDNKANQVVSKAMIESTGATVFVAENGLQVMELLSGQAFDLIFMDCQMPEMDGFEAVEKIRSLDDTRIAGIPVIALTADAQSETRELCLAKGMNDFLSKPFSLDQITGLMEKWLP